MLSAPQCFLSTDPASIGFKPCTRPQPPFPHSFHSTPRRRRRRHAPCPLQCFDITTLSEARPGAHKPLQVTAKELPRWSKAMMQLK